MLVLSYPGGRGFPLLNVNCFVETSNLKSHQQRMNHGYPSKPLVEPGEGKGEVSSAPLHPGPPPLEGKGVESRARSLSLSPSRLPESLRSMSLRGMFLESLFLEGSSLAMTFLGGISLRVLEEAGFPEVWEDRKAN
jgi:hypothetical protein